MTPLAYRIVHKRRENHDNWTLELDPVDDAIDRIGPGQFTMLYSFGVGEVPISTSGDVESRGTTLVHTIRAVGPVTKALCSARAGDVVGVRGPFGNRWPIEDAKRHDLLIVAGGVGLAPLRPAVYHALSHRNDFGRVTLLYGSRTPDDLLFRRELERWSGRSDIDVVVTVDAAPPSWTGNIGVVPTLLPQASFDPDDTVALACGPEIMMRFTAQALAERGIGEHRIFLSMERTMRCGIGLCGHCQLGPTLICRDGAVYSWENLRTLMGVPEL
jgi:NAD(P)H-flavin reductase